MGWGIRFIAIDGRYCLKKKKKSVLSFKLQTKCPRLSSLEADVERESLACEKFIRDSHLWKRESRSRIRQREKWVCHEGQRKPRIGQSPGSCGYKALTMVSTQANP